MLDELQNFLITKIEDLGGHIANSTARMENQDILISKL
jgi:hypothetical protein